MTTYISTAQKENPQPSQRVRFNDVVYTRDVTNLGALTPNERQEIINLVKTLDPEIGDDPDIEVVHTIDPSPRQHNVIIHQEPIYQEQYEPVMTIKKSVPKVTPRSHRYTPRQSRNSDLTEYYYDETTSETPRPPRRKKYIRPGGNVQPIETKKPKYRRRKAFLNSYSNSSLGASISNETKHKREPPLPPAQTTRLRRENNRPTPRVNVDQEAELNNTSEFVTTTILAPKADTTAGGGGNKKAVTSVPLTLNQQPNEPELMVKPETIFSKQSETSRSKRNATQPIKNIPAGVLPQEPERQNSLPPIVNLSNNVATGDDNDVNEASNNNNQIEKQLRVNSSEGIKASSPASRNKKPSEKLPNLETIQLNETRGGQGKEEIESNNRRVAPIYRQHIKRNEEKQRVKRFKPPRSLENLGFREPNIENARSKLGEFMRSENALNHPNPTKRKNYLNHYRQEREMPLSPKTKVENWLGRSVPGSPAMSASPNNLVKTINPADEKLPNINQGNTWVSDSDIKPPARKNYIKNQQQASDLNNKQIYNLVNELINRKPVQIRESDNIFEKQGTGKVRKVPANYTPQQAKTSTKNDAGPTTAAPAAAYNVEYAELPLTLKIGQLDNSNNSMLYSMAMQPQMNNDPSMQRHQATMNNAMSSSVYKPPNQYMTSVPSSMPYQNSMYPPSGGLPAAAMSNNLPASGQQQPVYYIPPSNMPYGAPQLQSVAPYGAYVIPYMPQFQQQNQQPPPMHQQPQPPQYYPQQPIQQMPPPQMQPQPPLQPNTNPIRSNIMRRAPSLQPALTQAPPPPKQPMRIINEAPALLQPNKQPQQQYYQPYQQQQPPPQQMQQQPLLRRPTLIDDPLRLPQERVKTNDPEPLTHQPLILYRYQKPVSTSDLRYPTEKYRDLIYRPRVSRVIDPLVYNTSLDDWLQQPSLNNPAPPIVEPLPALTSNRSTSNLVPTTRAVLYDDLKLPIQKATDRRPLLVNDLQLPKDKKIRGPLLVENLQYPHMKFIHTSMDDLNYRGKFRYPPEIDPDNEVDRKWLSMNGGIEEVTPEQYYRPKSVLAVQKIEMEAAQMSKALFNPREINELIELVKLDPNPTNIAERPTSSNVNCFSNRRHIEQHLSSLDSSMLLGFLSQFII